MVGNTPSKINKTFENTFISKSVKEKIKKIISNILSPSKLGVPRKLGFLFYGPPGTGKSSMAIAIAKEFGYTLRDIDLSELGAAGFQSMRNAISSKSVIVFNDIDRYSGFWKNEFLPNEKNENYTGINKSTMLKFLDAIELDNIIVIFTANDISRMDDAIIRSGRMDHKFFIDNPTYETVNDLFVYMYGKPYCHDNLTIKLPINMADVIHQSIQFSNTFEEASENLRKLVS